MKYNLADQKEANAAFEYLTKLVGQEAIAEVKIVRPPRSLNQNSYLHVLLGGYGLEVGYTIGEAKTIYKRDANPDIYVYTKNGQTFLRSSAELDVAEMTRSIDRFREFAKEQGIYLPPAENAEELRSLENAIEANQHYLR